MIAKFKQIRAGKKVAEQTSGYYFWRPGPGR